MWESNPPCPLVAGNTGFEVREAHQKPIRSQYKKLPNIKIQITNQGTTNNNKFQTTNSKLQISNYKQRLSAIGILAIPVTDRSEINTVDILEGFMYYFILKDQHTNRKGEAYGKREIAKDVHEYQETVSKIIRGGRDPR